MNYSEALSFTFQDKDWLKKMAIGGLIAFISFYCGLFFIFGFPLVGYYVGVIRNVVKGEEQPLPDWADMSKIFVDGILGGIIFLVYFVVIGGICALLIVSVANQYMPDHEKALLITLISVFTLLALTVFINFGLIQFAATDNFGSAFSLPGIFQLVKSHLGEFLAISMFSLILNGILLLAGLGILSPFTNFWGMVIQAHLFGQCAKAMHPVTTAVQSA
ncbi:DUF4013 domain-containing protein [candidate division KSB1 bacterium]|nr:DUF4013 domain-containing protein [candidate division KSB1 bacterium]NIR70587.1 DUF4013 domain-containing protein [candidate division KSB1 bacterium]NIS27723.1 DUF4013 domain-containing protein [candidate division KSB1 bacterium]NIT74551.1 DUF4013 domain-containing protein [candidate division KSB1 bacterium]NIU28376.1 DUF4013 domain-containing protein [candidate division KSB1 bacterium]